jgi:hypothetical protein
VELNLFKTAAQAAFLQLSCPALEQFSACFRYFHHFFGSSFADYE